MNQPILANIKIAAAGAAAPLVAQPLGDILLEPIEAGVGALSPLHDQGKELLLAFTEWLELAAVIVEDAHGTRETEFERPAGHFQSVVRITNATPQDGIDIYLEDRVSSQQAQLAVQNAQALLGNLVGYYIINADLQMIQAGAIQVIDPLGSQQVSVGDQTGNNSAPADMLNNLFQFRVQERFASADRDNGCPQRRQSIDAAKHGLERKGF
ncbi:exported hypothetical protein [Acidobacteriia bacterium SbA2]|nr:exported hypothetical protein [Acidobacteriia bacterium SbA2]